MPIITDIVYKPEKEKYWVYVDGVYCTSIRARTFSGMDIKKGKEITCEEVKEMENFHWKNVYGVASWEREKVRLDRVKNRIECFDERIVVNIVGFGADTTAYIARHPSETGKPDLEIRMKDKNILLLLVEVTGTETMRGTDYWVRPDKLDYARNHPGEDVWIILHYANPEEKFVYIKPDLARTYSTQSVTIRDSIERYVVFSCDDKDVLQEYEFISHLKGKIDRYRIK